MRHPPLGRYPALVVSAEERQALVVVQALGRAGIKVTTADTCGGTPASRSRWCSERELVPDAHADADAYVEQIIKVCETVESPVVIASDDGSIDALRMRRADIERVARLALAAEDAFSLAVNKKATLAVAQRLGIAVPPTSYVTNMAEASAAIARFGLPVIVKPSVSWMRKGPGGWRKGPILAQTADAVIRQAKRLADHGATALVQPWLGGSREAIHIFLANDIVWARFAVRADRMFPITGGSSVVRETIPMPSDLGPMAEALVREMSLEGYAEVEFRRDANGRPFLMEINPRLSAAVEVGVRAGVNIPLLLYSWAAGERLTAQLNYRVGQRMRWLTGDLRWLRDVFAHPEHPDAPPRAVAVGAFFAEFTKRAAYDYVTRDDLRPLLRFVLNLGSENPRWASSRTAGSWQRQPGSRRMGSS